MRKHFYLPAFQGLGEKANDSLDMMFDTTACGEYKSYNGSQSQPCHDDEEDGEEEEEEDHGWLLEFWKLCHHVIVYFCVGC